MGLKHGLKKQSRWQNGRVAAGSAQGKIEGILSTAKAMLMSHLDCNMVSDYTGLSLAEVAKLQAAPPYAGRIALGVWRATGGFTHIEYEECPFPF